MSVRYDAEHRQLVVGADPFERRLPVVAATIEDLEPRDAIFKERGVVVGFENRWELSIIWGGATYSDNHDWHGPLPGFRDTETQPFVEAPSTVEVGVLVPEPINVGPMITDEMAEALRGSTFPDAVLDDPATRRDRFTRLWGDPLAYVGANHLLALLGVMPRLPSHPDPAVLVDPAFDGVETFIATCIARFGIEP